MLVDQSGRTLDRMVNHIVARPARRGDKLREVGGRINDEPRINGDAMAAYPRTRPQDIYPRMPICQIDKIPTH